MKKIEEMKEMNETKEVEAGEKKSIGGSGIMKEIKNAKRNGMDGRGSSTQRFDATSPSYPG